MKKLLLGLAVFTSISAFASFSDDVRVLGVEDSFKIQTFKSCLGLSITIPHLRTECLKDIPELLEIGLTNEDISNITIEVREEEAVKLREKQVRTQQVRQIEDSVNSILNN